MFASVSGALARAVLICISFVLCVPQAFSQTAEASLQISGAPSDTAEELQPYLFRAGAVLQGSGSPSFEIENLPHWAVFDPFWGRLEGVPQPGDAGVYDNIQISVTDGELRASLPVFSIEVLSPPETAPLPPIDPPVETPVDPPVVPPVDPGAPASGSMPLSWQPPIANEDGTALVDLAGYRVYSGSSPDLLTFLVSIDSPALTDYLVESLPSGPHFFAVSAISAWGAESELSDIVSTLVP